MQTTDKICYYIYTYIQFYCSCSLPRNSGAETGGEKKMQAWSIVIILFGSLIAGFIQTLSGFGAGAIMMLIFSQLLEPVSAVAMTISVCIVMTAYLAFKFRKHIEWKMILVPLFPYLLLSTIINRVMKGLDVKLLGILFGVFQILLAIYFLFISASVKPRKDIGTGIVIGSISGLTASLFGVGGPFLSLYMVAGSSSAKSYAANLQFFFMITNVVILGEKLAAGHYPFDLWLLTLVGMVAIIVGARLGVILINKIDTEKMKKIVYWFLLVSGIITILQNAL